MLQGDLWNLTIVDEDAFYAEISRFGTGAAIIGLVNLISSYLFVTCLNHTAESQVFRIRTLFLRSVLRQDIGWYDTHPTGSFASRMADDLSKLQVTYFNIFFYLCCCFQDGIGEKIGMFIYFMTIFTASIINAFVHGWELALVIMAAMPVLIIAVSICARATAAFTEKELNIYGKAGAIAEEVLSAIRTVIAFGGEDREIERYDGKLVGARKAGVMRGAIVAVGAGFMWFIIYASYALAFWYGVKLIMDDRDLCEQVTRFMNWSLPSAGSRGVLSEIHSIKSAHCLPLGSDGSPGDWPSQSLCRGVFDGQRSSGHHLCYC